jgi:glutathione S-transferase
MLEAQMSAPPPALTPIERRRAKAERAKARRNELLLKDLLADPRVAGNEPRLAALSTMAAPYWLSLFTPKQFRRILDAVQASWRTTEQTIQVPA